MRKITALLSLVTAILGVLAAIKKYRETTATPVGGSGEYDTSAPPSPVSPKAHEPT
jgi:hypothetical protein